MLLGNIFGNKDDHTAVQRWKSCLLLPKPRPPSVNSLFRNDGGVASPLDGTGFPAGSRKGIKDQRGGSS